jgi:hypothetical protein
MAEAEGFAFSVPNGLPLYFWPARLYFRKEQGKSKSRYLTRFL